jgi:ATP-dependent RNA helicase UAP56/SUB2
MLDFEEDEDFGGDEPAEESRKGHFVGVHSTNFRDFGLKPEIMHSVADCGFEQPSQVQHEAIPQALLGLDILC